MNELHPIDMTRLIAPWVANRKTIGGALVPAFPPGDPHWKKVRKERARKKAAKKHKKHMRRCGK